MHQQTDEDALYYVTVRDAGRTGYLKGPYGTHGEALSQVSDARRLAEKANAWACFYSFGTARCPASRRISTVFGR